MKYNAPSLILRSDNFTINHANDGVHEQGDWGSERPDDAADLKKLCTAQVKGVGRKWAITGVGEVGRRV